MMTTIDNTDPRYVRSRLKLRSAFLELAHEDPENLSVSAVCERTGIDRATFYRHFDTLDDLVADAIVDLAEQATAQWESTSTGSGEQYAESSEIFVAYMNHVQDNWKLYRWALGPTGSSKTLHALLKSSTASVASELRRTHPEVAEDEIQFRAAFAAGGIIGSYIHWLSSETPQLSGEQLTKRVLHLSLQRFE